MTNKIRKPFDKSVPVQVNTGSTSFVQQHAKDECDINKLMSRYEKHGVIDHVARGQPTFADVSEAVDYQTAVNVVKSADTAFRALPASLRALYDNDPHALLEAIDAEDEQLLAELRKLKMLPEVVADSLPPDAVESPSDKDGPKTPPAAADGARGAADKGSS